MTTKEKSYKIKIPIFTTEMLDDTDSLFGRITYKEMIDGVKTKINAIQSESSFDNRNKTKKTVISKVNFTEHLALLIKYIFIYYLYSQNRI